MSNELCTLGHAAGRFQRSPKAIRAALRAIRATPELTLNDLEYWRTHDVERAVVWLQETGLRDDQVKGGK